MDVAELTFGMRCVTRDLHSNPAIGHISANFLQDCTSLEVLHLSLTGLQELPPALLQPVATTLRVM